MAQDYTEWLAVNVLNEQQLISYRSLSRALKVHSNLAKQMLYDFHRKQNARKPGSVHATYLITGIKAAEKPQIKGTDSQQDGEDTVMQISPPFPSSSMPRPEEDEPEPILTRTVMLVKQEYLDQAKASFESVTGIHIYSLEAKGLSDIQSLTECNRKIAADYASEDPLEAWKQYGTIQNSNVKRRTQRRQPPVPAPAVAKDAASKTKSLQPTTKPTVLEKQASKDKDNQEAKPASKPSSVKATPEPPKKPPAATKRQNSDIFKSFAKGKTKPKKEESKSSVEPSQPADEAMGGFSDEEPDADEGAGDEVEEVPKVPEGKSKRQREEELQAMMDQEDEVMEDAADATPEDGVGEEDDNDAAIDKPEAKPADQPKETVTVENGRRRGRRRVMKKKTVKDEDGYLGKCAVTLSRRARIDFRSDEGRGSLGIIFRRRACAEEGEGTHGTRCQQASARRGQESRWRKAGAGQHHVFLREEVGLKGNDIQKVPTAGGTSAALTPVMLALAALLFRTLQCRIGRAEEAVDLHAHLFCFPCCIVRAANVLHYGQLMQHGSPQSKVQPTFLLCRKSSYSHLHIRLSAQSSSPLPARPATTPQFGSVSRRKLGCAGSHSFGSGQSLKCTYFASSVTRSASHASTFPRYAVWLSFRNSPDSRLQGRCGRIAHSSPKTALTISISYSFGCLIFILSCIAWNAAMEGCTSTSCAERASSSQYARGRAAGAGGVRKSSSMDRRTVQSESSIRMRAYCVWLKESHLVKPARHVASATSEGCSRVTGCIFTP